MNIQCHEHTLLRAHLNEMSLCDTANDVQSFMWGYDNVHSITAHTGAWYF